MITVNSLIPQVKIREHEFRRIKTDIELAKERVREEKVKWEKKEDKSPINEEVQKVAEVLTPENRLRWAIKDNFDIETVNTLYRAWEIGCDDTEAARVAGIRPSDLKRYMNASDELYEMRELLTATPRVLAKQNIENRLRNDKKGDFSLRYMEKVKPEEFGGKGAVININNDNRSVTVEDKMAKITELLESIG